MDIKEKLQSITDPYREKEKIYEIMDELGITYKKTNCKKCITDYYNICLEEVGMIEDASEMSAFNSEYTYRYPRTIIFKGKKIGKHSSQATFKWFSDNCKSWKLYLTSL